ncbi:MAG: fluoride efflux transporter FluC, partial [Gammaproteobacteria bacterium]
NVLGCFLMGFMFFETLERVSMNPVLRTAILTGGLGGFTTFSTFAMETLLLIEDGETAYAVAYLVLSVLLGLLAALLGAYIARNL